MRIGVFGNSYQAAHLDELRGFLYWLRSNSYELLIHYEFADYLRRQAIEIHEMEIIRMLPSDVSIVISIGGDGTFLKAAEWVGALELPVMGINTGHLGYLTAFSFSDFDTITAALQGNYGISSRMTLEVESPFLPEGFSSIALNEVAILKGDTASMVEIEAKIGDKYIADYLADGLVIATPTGSTAYNLSCGGPIMQPTLDSMILTPIAPHSLTLRPLVVDANAELSFEVRSRGDECHIGVDGRTFIVSSDGSTLKISRGHYRVNVMQPPGIDFARILRNKLNWGG